MKSIINGKLNLFNTITVPITPICATSAKVDIMNLNESIELK